jgi:hypothetical protein
LVVNDVSAHHIGSISKGQVGPPKECPETIKLRYVTSKKMGYLIYTAAQASQHALIKSAAKSNLK